MVKSCSVGGCMNRSEIIKCSDNGIRFFRFPYSKNGDKSKQDKRKKWADACNRLDPVSGKSWQPRDDVKGVYICSVHFLTGKPSLFSCHTDYVPSLLLPSNPVTATSGQRSKLKRYDNQQSQGEKEDAPKDGPHQEDFSLSEDSECGGETNKQMEVVESSSEESMLPGSVTASACQGMTRRQMASSDFDMEGIHVKREPDDSEVDFGGWSCVENRADHNLDDCDEKRTSVVGMFSPCKFELECEEDNNTGSEEPLVECPRGGSRISSRGWSGTYSSPHVTRPDTARGGPAQNRRRILPTEVMATKKKPVNQEFWVFLV